MPKLRQTLPYSYSLQAEKLIFLDISFQVFPRRLSLLLKKLLAGQGLVPLLFFIIQRSSPRVGSSTTTA